MGLAARRRLAVVLPWAALVVVTVFALTQARARHRAERRHGDPASASPLPEAALPAGLPETPLGSAAASALERGAAAAEAALDAALLDLEASAEREAALRAALHEAGLRAERAEAARAVLEGRLAAAEGPPAPSASEALEQGVLRARVTELEARLAEATGPVEAWLKDAASEDVERRAAAVEAARGASSTRIDQVVSFVQHDPAAWADAAARLLPALPDGKARNSLVLALLTEPAGDLPARLAAVEGSVLAEPSVLVVLLRRAPVLVLEGVLARVPADAFEAEAAGTFAKALRPRLDTGDVREATAVVQAVGRLRLHGFATPLATLLGASEPAQRAAAAHALSRVADLEEVRGEAIAGLRALLLDDVLAVRRAALLLAEALFGAEASDYDPAAGQAERELAVERILDRAG